MSVYLDADGNAWLRPVTVIALHTTTEVFTIGEGHVPLSGEQGAQPLLTVNRKGEDAHLSTRGTRHTRRAGPTRLPFGPL